MKVTLETSLYYITHHSESIIQWLFLAILVMASTLIARSLFAKKVPFESVAQSRASESGGEIQSFLQKILDQTAKLETVSLEKMDSGNRGEIDAQVQTLKKELQSREEEIGQLKASGQMQPSADADKVANRIKELESKLAEYEILEDDIADLSLYKDENARLRAELERIKGGASAVSSLVSSATPTAEIAAVDVTEPTPESSVVHSMSSPGDDIVAEFAQAVNQETVQSSGEPVPLTATGDAMADFESAIKLEKKMTGAAPLPAIAVESKPAAAVTEGEDLFSEFAVPSAEAEAALDTDKMMAEMAALVSLEPSKDSGLEEGIDTEKMALEANTLTKI